MTTKTTAVGQSDLAATRTCPGGRAQYAPRHHRLAVHLPAGPRQAQETLSGCQSPTGLSTSLIGEQHRTTITCLCRARKYVKNREA
jgi:hypothetical protein